MISIAGIQLSKKSIALAIFYNIMALSLFGQGQIPDILTEQLTLLANTETKENSCILHYKFEQDKLHITFSANNKQSTHQVEIKNLETEVQHYIRAIKTQGNNLDICSQQLFRRLIEPVEKDIVGYEKINIIPEEYLLGLTFDYLQKTNKPLILSHAISYFYSIEQLLSSENNNAQPSICLLAPITTSSNNTTSSFRSMSAVQKALPFTLNEVTKTVKIFQNNRLKTAQLINYQATKGKLYNAVKNYSIIHIASHGDYEKDGIYLHSNSDNKNSEFESFLGNGLDTENLNTQLIVLSACKTANEKNYNKPNSLLFNTIKSGIPNALGSLWNVHDKSTQKLMVSFYKHLIEENLSYSKALQCAKIDCIKEGMLPMDWAGFVLFGN